ncbi:MAG: hypothetical protein NZR01_15225 [Bryobacteraceae bacterium]|nr:hypothetical protein [Bryobacteraceae bacterium]
MSPPMWLAPEGNDFCFIHAPGSANSFGASRSASATGRQAAP